MTTDTTRPEERHVTIGEAVAEVAYQRMLAQYRLDEARRERLDEAWRRAIAPDSEAAS